MWAEREATLTAADKSTGLYEVIRRELDGAGVEIAKYFDLAHRINRGESVEHHGRAADLYSKLRQRLELVAKVVPKVFGAVPNPEHHRSRVTLRHNAHAQVAATISELLVRMVPLCDPREAATLHKVRQAAAGGAGDVARVSPGVATQPFDLWEYQRRHACGAFAAVALRPDDGFDAWGALDGAWGYSTRASVNPQRGLRWAGKWAVAGGSGDADGWEYARHFRVDQGQWSAKSNFALHSVRRRHWTRRQVTAKPAADHAGPGLPVAAPLGRAESAGF